MLRSKLITAESCLRAEGAGNQVFGKKHDDSNTQLRERLEHGGGQRAWAVVLDYKSRYQTGRYAVVPVNQIDHATLTLRVEPEGDAPFETTVRATFARHAPHKNGSIGVIFDPSDHSKLAVCPEWVFSPDSVNSVRRQEMIAAFLGRG
jgi:hypothetical protein